MINGNEYPVVFMLRTIDSDIRTQIFEIYTTKEDGSFHGAGKQKSADGHPNYEASPSSGGTITQENGDVKDDVQNQLRTNTLTDHETLDMAAKELDTSKLTEGERAALDIFRKKVNALKALKEERLKQGSLYHEAQFGENRELSAHPSPPPFGRYLDRRERQELCANLKHYHKPKFCRSDRRFGRG